MTYQLYIGANNATGRLERAKIERIVASRHTGFTYQPATGYWAGAREPSAIVTVSDKRSKVLATASELKRALHQDAIGVMPGRVMEFV